VLLTMGFAVVVTLWLWFHASIMPPNHDSMALLSAASRMLTGGHYYSEILEVNPPLILIILSPVFGVSRVLRTSIEVSVLLWIEALLIASVILARPQLQRLFRIDKTESWALALALLFFLNAIPGDFGERDHLMVAFAIPAICWFIGRELGENNARLPCGVLVVGSLGFLLKPQSLVIPAFLIIAATVRARSWRRLLDPCVFGFCFVAAAYAAIILLVFPDYLRVAALAADLYGYFGKSPHILVYRVLPMLAVTAFLVVIFETIEIEPRTRTIARFLAGLATVGFLTLVLQGKGFSYHYLPGIFATMALIGLAASRLTLQWRRKLSLPAVLAMIVALCTPLLSIAGSHLSAVIYQPRSRILALQFYQTAQRLAAGRSFLAMDTTLGPAFPTVTMIGAAWSSRSPHQWLIPGILDLEKGDTEEQRLAARYKALAFDMMVEDLQRYRPDIVAVNVAPTHELISGPFNFLKFYGQDSRFGKLWSDYTLVESIPDWDFYRRVD